MHGREHVWHIVCGALCQIPDQVVCPHWRTFLVRRKCVRCPALIRQKLSVRCVADLQHRRVIISDQMVCIHLPALYQTMLVPPNPLSVFQATFLNNSPKISIRYSVKPVPEIRHLVFWRRDRYLGSQCIYYSFVIRSSSALVVYYRPTAPTFSDLELIGQYTLPC